MESSKGQEVYRQTFLDSQNLPLKKGDTLYHQDTLFTGTKSQLTLNFKGGWRVQLQEKTQIFLEKKIPSDQEPHHHLHLLKGDIKLLQKGKYYPLWIVQKGKFFLAENLLKKETEEDTPSSLAPLGKHPVNQISSPGEGNLSNEKIMKKLEKKKSFFFGCYKQLLKKDPFSKGQLQIHFFISSKGRTTQAQVQSSRFHTQNPKDLQKFYKCLLKEIRKTHFPPFKGESLPVSFPLQFS